MRVQAEATAVRIRSTAHAFAAFSIRPCGRCVLCAHAESGMGELEANGGILYVGLKSYEWDQEFCTARVVSFRAFRAFIREHKELITRIIDGWSLRRDPWGKLVGGELDEDAQTALYALEGAAARFGAEK